MIGVGLTKLLEISGDPLGSGHTNANSSYREIVSSMPELKFLLKKKDGFFAFENALRVFPVDTTEESYGLGDWNSNDLWRSEYPQSCGEHFFFSENIFGDQFSIKNKKIYEFDSETGEERFIADSLEDWAQQLLLQYDVMTGHRISKEWQERHRPLRGKERLMPKIPFVLGGSFLIENLFAIDSVKGMKAKGNLAHQIQELPDGTKIKFEITP